MMKTASTRKVAAPTRKNERGAALITVLLLSMLMLAAGGALVMTTSMTATTATDATGESQAYNAAEAGLQATLNVLRGHVAPSPMPATNPSGSVAQKNKLTFRRAVVRGSCTDATIPSSNKPCDPVTAPLRLSRWLNYNYTPSGGAYADRVVIGNAASYTPYSGLAYDIEVSDPDDTEHVTYSTTGLFSNNTLSINLPGIVGNLLNITYQPQPSTTVTAYTTATGGPAVGAVLGKFNIVKSGLALINVNAPISITVNMTKPWVGTATFTGSLVGSVTSLASLNLSLNVTKTVATINGVTFTLPSSLNLPLQLSPVNGTVLASDPHRLLVTSTGYGPRGARKQLQMMVSNYAFDITVPSTLTLAGGTGISYDLSNSNAANFSGYDLSNSSATPLPFVTVSPTNVPAAQTGNNTSGGTVTPSTAGALTPLNTPSFLTSPQAARDFLSTVKATAQTQGRLYSTKPATSTMGTSDDPKLTVIDNYDGDPVVLGTGHQGTGLLVVTGDLDTDGNTDFEGVILVLGRGRMTRSGGGSGVMEGAIIVACFNPDGTETSFCNPTFMFTNNGNGNGAGGGGGNSTTQYSSAAVAKALAVSGRGILGVVEN